MNFPDRPPFLVGYPGSTIGQLGPVLPQGVAY